MMKAKLLTTIGRVACIAAFSVGLAACSGAKAEEERDPNVLLDADVEAMYNIYISGDYAAYVNQMESLDDKPESYRKQMADLMKQRHRQQEEDHNGGPAACHVKDLKINHEGRYCDAFIVVTYKDSTEEEILLPLVFKNEKWRLK